MLAALAGKTVAVDPERSVAAIFEALDKAGAKIDFEARPLDPAQGDQERGRDRGPPRRPGARRRGARRASSTGCRSRRPRAASTSSSAAAKLQEFRQQGGDLRDLSFDTISGAGPNGAIVHYRVSEETNRPLEMDSIYLVDSGGQYPDGTTDVTRTVAIGTPTRGDERPLHPGPQGPYRGRPRALPGRHARLAARQLRPPVPLAGGARLRPRHRPRRRQLPRGPRRAAAHLAGRQRPGRRRRAAQGRHVPLQRARLLQDRRIWHPGRESGAGRAGARSRGARRRCSASRPSPSRRSTAI